MVAGIWCKEHSPKTIVHQMSEAVDESSMNALQLYTQNYKQADLTLTGTARKANLVDQSTRTVPTTAAPTSGNRRTSTANPTPTSARGRQSNAGISVKDEESNGDATASKPERRCANCSIDASPRWWKIEERPPPEQDSSQMDRVVDGIPPTNGDGVPASESLHHPEGLPMPNGVGDHDHKMSDAPPVGVVDGPTRLKVDTDISVSRETLYLCQKCHWKKLNAPDEPEEPERSESQLPEPQQLPLRSPPIHAYGPPMPAWVPASSLPPQPPHIAGWGGHGPPLSNGIMHTPQPTAPIPHHQPFHAPQFNALHQTNGYQPLSGPGVHPPGAVRSPYPPVNAPAPLHLNNSPMLGALSNGMHSPHLPYSPTHPPGSIPSRQSDSPFSGSQPHSQYPGQHGSPGPGQLHNRPSTPRDTTMRDAPVGGPQGENRLPGGASASPSLRNLLH